MSRRHRFMLQCCYNAVVTILLVVTGTPLSTTKVALTAKTAMDVDSQGTINGIPTYEFDLDSLPAEDKPWRNPGENLMMIGVSGR